MGINESEGKMKNANGFSVSKIDLDLMGWKIEEELEESVGKVISRINFGNGKRGVFKKINENCYEFISGEDKVSEFSRPKVHESCFESLGWKILGKDLDRGENFVEIDFNNDLFAAAYSHGDCFYEIIEIKEVDGQTLTDKYPEQEKAE